MPGSDGKIIRLPKNGTLRPKAAKQGEVVRSLGKMVRSEDGRRKRVALCAHTAPSFATALRTKQQKKTAVPGLTEDGFAMWRKEPRFSAKSYDRFVQIGRRDHLKDKAKRIFI